MNEISTTQPVSAETLEHVLATGDLSKLSNEQRVEYFVKTCQSLGLNPLTRPFRFLTFNGQQQLYATKDGTDQLRALRGITLHIVDKQMDAGLYIVTARARTKDGREDEDIGAVALPSGGESRANALMKGTTKAKRRVTLSICGLGGMPDESELDGMPGAQTFDPEDDPPVAPIRAAAPRVSEPRPKSTPEPQPARKTWAQWADAMEIAERDSKTPQELGRMIATDDIQEAVRLAREGPYTPAKARVIAAYEKAEQRYLADPPDPPEPEADDLPDVEIIGGDKLNAG